MDSHQLEEIGFSTAEAKIYLTLINSNGLFASEISKRSELNRRTTYDVLQRLQNKGFVSTSIESNRNIFYAVEPVVILSKIDDLKLKAQKLLPELEEIYKSTADDQETTTFTGKKGIKSILQQILNSKQYLAFGSNEKFPELMAHEFDLFQKEKLRRKIKSKVLLSEEMRSNNFLNVSFTSVKFLPKILSQPTTTFIFDGCVAIIIWSDIPIGVLIKNKTLFKTYSSYFNFLWVQANN